MSEATRPMARAGGGDDAGPAGGAGAGSAGGAADGSPPPAHGITRLTADGLADRAGALADLLVDTVAGGASLGFLTSFDRRAATSWWSARCGEVAAGALIVWAAEGSDGLTGTISLAPVDIPNGRHRADIRKLMVHPTARGRGLARALMATAEAAAARAGITLLMLDTVAGTPAEHLYLSSGWTRYGTVPDFAADPAGALEECSFFYKRVVPSSPT
jgi:GNAT superfamily N-acetyltransferase